VWVLARDRAQQAGTEVPDELEAVLAGSHNQRLTRCRPASVSGLELESHPAVDAQRAGVSRRRDRPH